MNRKSRCKKSPLPDKSKSKSESKLWFKEVSDSLFKSTASGPKWNSLTASSKGVIKTGVNSSLSRVHGPSPPVGKSEGSVRSIPPGVDPEWIWRKFLKEREKSKKLQVEIGQLRVSLDQRNKALKEKSREIDSKNLVIKRLIKEKSVLEARHDVMEDEIDIDDLLKANLGELITKDVLKLTDNTFPVDLIDLDFPSQDLKTDQLYKSLPSSSIKLRKISAAEAKEVSELFQIPNRGNNTKTDKQKKVGDTKKGKVPRFQKVSPLKILKDDKDFKLVKKSQKLPPLRPNYQQFKPNPLASEKLLSSLTISCPHCDKTFPKSSQWRLVEHMNSSHNATITYPCQYCDKQFTYKSILTAHMMRHKSTYPWECGKCGYKPRDIRSFAKHVKSVHGVAHLEEARKMLLLNKS